MARGPRAGMSADGMAAALVTYPHPQKRGYAAMARSLDPPSVAKARRNFIEGLTGLDRFELELEEALQFEDEAHSFASVTSAAIFW